MIEEEEMEPTDTFQIYDGPTFTFSKASGADPGIEANQDRISDNVWITRGNTGGEIYNAKSEESSTKGASPAGTRWAVGDIADFATLEYKTFRNAVGEPKDVVGKKLVLYLIEDDIYIPVEFTSWAKNNPGGGFSYERGTEN